MKKAILIHGWGGDSSENWLPWLKKELEKENIIDLVKESFKLISNNYLEVLYYFIIIL